MKSSAWRPLPMALSVASCLVLVCVVAATGPGSVRADESYEPQPLVHQFPGGSSVSFGVEPPAGSRGALPGVAFASAPHHAILLAYSRLAAMVSAGPSALELTLGDLREVDAAEWSTTTIESIESWELDDELKIAISDVLFTDADGLGAIGRTAYRARWEAGRVRTSWAEPWWTVERLLDESKGNGAPLGTVDTVRVFSVPVTARFEGRTVSYRAAAFVLVDEGQRLMIQDALLGGAVERAFEEDVSTALSEAELVERIPGSDLLSRPSPR